MIPHRDANDVGPSWTMPMGDCQGGLWWVESKKGRALPPYTATGLGPETKGSSHVTQGNWLNLE
eukprot:5508483-Prorocentrum_lima.AAC.1